VGGLRGTRGVLSGGLSKLYSDGSIGITSVASCSPARKQWSDLWKSSIRLSGRQPFRTSEEEEDHPTLRKMPTRKCTLQQHPSGAHNYHGIIVR